MAEFKEFFFARKRWYDADSVDSRIEELKAKNLILAEKNKAIEAELCEQKNKFREFNDRVCRKVVDAAKTLSSISQDSQMDFYEEFIKE